MHTREKMHMQDLPEGFEEWSNGLWPKKPPLGERGPPNFRVESISWLDKYWDSFGGCLEETRLVGFLSNGVAVQYLLFF